ncbi:MAG: hypothetical protein ACP5OA_03295 [Candidatus Woesearchaeota archaeon]
MNKTIKKIVALGMGATMLAGTAAMALAVDLGDYPSPFIKDSVFVGKIVIGERAAAIDVLGATDIAASLQRDAAVGVAGTSSSTSTATSGYKFSENNDLVLGARLDSVTSVVDDSDLPELLASGTIEADDGTEYDYDVEIDLTGTLGRVYAEITSDIEDEGYTTPIVYFDTSAGLLYTTTVAFDDKWAATDFVNSETIELFGSQYTFDPDNTKSDDVLILYGSETTMLIAKDGKETVTFNGKEYTLEVLGGNSDDSSAVLRINGDTRTVREGDSKTMPSGGLPVYVKNVFVSNIGGDDVSVQLFIGSNKLELDADANTVTKNGVELDGVTFTRTTTAGDWWDNVTDLTFAVDPSATEDEIDYILPGTGNDFADPVFGAFKFEFVGAKDLMAGKEVIEFERNGDKLDLTFLPREANAPITVTLAKNNLSTDADIWRTSTLNELTEDAIFFWNDGTADDNYATHVLQVTSIKKGALSTDDSFEVVVKDLSHGKTYTADTLDKALSSDIGLYLKTGATNDTIDLSTTSGGLGSPAPTNFTLYTKAGARILLDLSSVEVPTAEVTEDVDADYDTLGAGNIQTYTVTAAYDGTDDEYDLDVTGTPVAFTDKGADDNVNYDLSKFGTFVAEEKDDNGAYVKLYVPSTEVHYDMFMMPLNAEVIVTSSSTSGAVALNPISVGMAILDSEANLGAKPYIVVGGPCANTAAAALVGNPADCAAGFTEGKAMIKLFSAQNALLVAGYSGKDTQGACRVLANYADYGFSGTELEVVTTNLNSLSVKKLS